MSAKRTTEVRRLDSRRDEPFRRRRCFDEAAQTLKNPDRQTGTVSRFLAEAEAVATSRPAVARTAARSIPLDQTGRRSTEHRSEGLSEADSTKTSADPDTGRQTQSSPTSTQEPTCVSDRSLLIEDSHCPPQQLRTFATNCFRSLRVRRQREFHIGGLKMQS